MSSHNSQSSSSDPRQPSTAKPYVPLAIPQENLPIDYSSFIAILFGIAGVMFRYKLGSWLALIFCAQSIANMRNIETELKQISTGFMFAVMGIITNYLTPPRPGTKT